MDEKGWSSYEVVPNKHTRVLGPFWKRARLWGQTVFLQIGLINNPPKPLELWSPSHFPHSNLHANYLRLFWHTNWKLQDSCQEPIMPCTSFKGTPLLCPGLFHMLEGHAQMQDPYHHVDVFLYSICPNQNIRILGDVYHLGFHYGYRILGLCVEDISLPFHSNYPKKLHYVPWSIS